MRHSDIIDFFNLHTPYAIGFDRLVERLNQTTNTSEQTSNMSIVSTNVNVFGGY